MAWSWHERPAWAWGCSAWVLPSEWIKSDICIAYYQNLIAYRTSTCDFYIGESPLLCISSFSFQSKLLPPVFFFVFFKDCLVLQGKSELVCLWYVLECVWYVLECVWLSPPPSPMVVVYGIAKTTVICSVIEAVCSKSCMNHVGVVHLKEGEREKKPSIWKIPNNYSDHWFLFQLSFFLPFVFLITRFVCLFVLLTCQSGHGTNMPSPCPF